MPKNGPEVAPPLLFRVERTDDGASFTWRLLDPREGSVLATGGAYDRRRDAKEAIRLIVRHAAHAQMEDLT